ncbi:MAG: cellulase N-terminal Ig-like domain-containing protein, partial [Fimbriimonas sp.]
MHIGLLILTLANAPTVDVSALTDRVLLVHYDEGYVVHHGKGQKRSDEKVVISPLNVERATRVDQYRIASKGESFQPMSIARKSKGTDFAWFVDSWVDGRAVNTRPDHTKEHWIYLRLPKPLVMGRSYTVATPEGSSTLTYNPASSRSEAVHVNLLGYVPAAPKKFAYVYQWMGDGGSLDLKAYEGKTFSLIDQATRKKVFSGKVKFRTNATNQETFHVSDTPNGNFNGADVYECDFSAFKKPGKYVVSVDGIGCSFPFRLDPDIYREAFRTTARGLYHNRSGIELK